MLKVKGCNIALNGTPITELPYWIRVTVLPAVLHTGKRTPPWPQPDRLVLDLPTPEGWKAELT